MWLALRQLQSHLPGFPDQRATPPMGWVAAVRQGLGMSAAQLASRLGVTRAAVSQLEQREAEGGATIKALRQAADALGCELVYAIVPRSGTFEDLVQQRAAMVAKQLVGRANHSMRLEDQQVEQHEVSDQEQVVTRRLLAEWPRDLWDTEWDRRAERPRR